MLPSRHIIFGAIASALLFLAFPSIGLAGSIIIFLSSVLIDVDHYLYYAIRYNDWNLKNAYKWFIHKSRGWNKLSLIQKENYPRVILLLHGVECLVVLALLILVDRAFLFIIIGFIIHLLLDLIELYNNNESLMIKTSQIYVYKRNKKIKNTKL